jgi:hypothetical protein
VLGIARSGSCWNWAAHGKHPSAKDFFKIGYSFPLADGFADWVRKGYQSAPEWDRSGTAGYSWRFWARGKTRNDLACGLLRDSSDSVGRPYPLLITGSGCLPSWEERWELLPWMCEGTWRHMEYISAQRFNNLEKLEVELLRTKPPCPDWPAIHSMDREAGSPDFISRFPVLVAEQLKNGVVRLSLNDLGNITVNSKHDDVMELVLRMNSIMKSDSGKTPGAVFMGGTFERMFVVFFYRALNADDFKMLWSPDNGNNN